MDTTTLDRILSLYRAGSYPIAICRETGVSLTHIYRTLHKAGVVLRPGSESHRRHQMDFTFFERIDSHAKAQVLGFIAADGCISPRNNVIKVAIAHEDHAYLEWMKGVIGYTGDVRVYPARRPNEQPLSWLNLCSPKMVTDITALGCGPRKSLTLDFPTSAQVPDEFLASYMLGYFEGDGSLSSVRRTNRPSPEYILTICGTEAFCRRYGEVLGMQTGVGVTTDPRSRIHMLRLNGNRQIKRAMDFLYSHATYTLARKRHQYDLLCAQLDALDARRAQTVAV